MEDQGSLREEIGILLLEEKMDSGRLKLQISRAKFNLPGFLKCKKLSDCFG